MPRRAPPDRFQDLIEAATRVFLAQGYRRTQMGDVAAPLGVAKGTLYLYVESKEALFDAVAAPRGPAASRSARPTELPLRTPRARRHAGEVERAARRGRRAARARARRSRGARVTRRPRRAERGAAASSTTRSPATARDQAPRPLRADYPELAKLWYRAGREGALALLTRYLDDRARRGRLRRFEDGGVAARIVLETLVFWAVHRHWDPSPQAVDEDSARTARLLASALVS